MNRDTLYVPYASSYVIFSLRNFSVQSPHLATRTSDVTEYCRSLESVFMKTDVVSQCFCPIAECQFSHSSWNLYKHFSDTHSKEVRKFRFGEPIAIGYDDREKTLFQDEDEGVIFVLHQSLGREERRFELLVIGSPSEFETAFDYALKISCYRIVVSLEAVPRVCPQWVPHYPIERFLPLPHSFRVPGRIELTIKKSKRPQPARV